MTEALNYDVVSLAATAEREVEQDLISITFVTIQSGPDSAKVQEELVRYTNETLELVKPLKKGQQLRVETGGMTVQPRYGKKSTIDGYVGRSTIVVSGTDMKTISGLTGTIKGMSVEGIEFSVSPGLSKRVLKKLTLEAIENFQEKALEVSTAFGAVTSKMINVNVNSGQGRNNYRNVRASAMALSASAAPEAGGGVMAEGGKETLQASVNGSVQLVR
jgi:predicted secreted protein